MLWCPTKASLAQAVAQAAAAQPEEAYGLGEVAVALTQGVGEARGLVLEHVRARRESRVGRDCRSWRRQTLPRQDLGIEHRGRLEQDDPLQEMTQFPRIAWPGI